MPLPYPTNEDLADRLAASAVAAPAWGIFDNTVLGAATLNALDLLERFAAASN